MNVAGPSRVKKFQDPALSQNLIVDDLPSHTPDSFTQPQQFQPSSRFYCPPLLQQASENSDIDDPENLLPRPIQLGIDRRRYLLRVLRPRKSNATADNVYEENGVHEGRVGKKNERKRPAQEALEHDVKAINKRSNSKNCLVIAAEATRRVLGPKNGFNTEMILQGQAGYSVRRKWAETCREWTVDELKAYLRASNQTLVGSKNVLVRRVCRHLMPKVSTNRS